jgi:hypothetical protein
VDQHGFPNRYASVLRFVQKLRGSCAPDAKSVIVVGGGRDPQKPGTGDRAVAIAGPGEMS